MKKIHKLAEVKETQAVERSVAKKRKPAGDGHEPGEVTIDRRDGDRRGSDRRGNDRRKAAVPVQVEHRKLERRAKVSRRRQIDPTTCERDYSDAEIEFMNAIEEYKRSSGRMFPTCSEILEVLQALGYAKLSPAASAEAVPALTPAAVVASDVPANQAASAV